jgi:hypothetical protein
VPTLGVRRHFDGEQELGQDREHPDAPEELCPCYPLARRHRSSSASPPPSGTMFSYRKCASWMSLGMMVTRLAWMPLGMRSFPDEQKQLHTCGSRGGQRCSGGTYVASSHLGPGLHHLKLCTLGVVGPLLALLGVVPPLLSGVTDRHRDDAPALAPMDIDVHADIHFVLRHWRIRQAKSRCILERACKCLFALQIYTTRVGVSGWVV